MAKASEQRRDLIERMALRLFAERGYAAVSVRDIAQACGIGESALYRHMTSKDELAIRVFREAYLGFAQELLEAAEPEAPLVEKLGAYLEVMLSAFDRDPDLLQFLLGRQHDIIMQAITAEDVTPLTVVRDALLEAQARGEIRLDNPILGTAMVMGAAFQPLTFARYGRIPSPTLPMLRPMLAGILRLLGATLPEDLK
ncbi:helix-turn-helix domain containing protein (plasmid) [Salipiger sp. H15]|uniref:Helix-turn-helix domain containing protein n=1 Tax=Alloyangia sp. H15 TaxID=3029062 RepID=A0AAU8ARS7_9RHOB